MLWAVQKNTQPVTLKYLILLQTLCCLLEEELTPSYIKLNVGTVFPM